MSESKELNKLTEGIIGAPLKFIQILAQVYLSPLIKPHWLIN